MSTDVLASLGAAVQVHVLGPVAVWTVLAGGALVGLATLRRLHPLMGYRVRQGLLFALPLAWVLSPFVPSFRSAGPTAVPTMGARASVELGGVGGFDRRRGNSVVNGIKIVRL